MDSVGDGNLDLAKDRVQKYIDLVMDLAKERAQKYLDLAKERAEERAEEYLSMKGSSDLPEFEMMMKKRQKLDLPSKEEGEGEGVVETTTMKKKQKLDPGNVDTYVPTSTSDDKLKMFIKVILGKCEDILDDPIDLRGKGKDIGTDKDIKSDSDEDPNLYMDDDDEGESIGSKDKTSNFTRERVSRVKVTKAQYTPLLDEEEKKFYHSDLYKKHIPRQATKAEMKRLLDASNKSQGFDIPFFPGVGYLPVFRLNLCHEPGAIKTAQLSKLALKWYNKAKDTKYALQRIVKATGKPCAYLIYCITFMATDNSGPAETFQARVWVKFNYNVHIMMCRKKGEPDPDWKLIDFSLEENDDDELVEYDDDDDDDDDESQEDDDSDEEAQEDDDQPQRRKDDQPQAQVGQSL